MRTGFDTEENFPALLDCLAESGIDFATVHARTVADLYRGPVRYPLIRLAARRLPCPVFANGNITSARRALEILEETGAAGLMIGRAAIRNPWIFRQIRESLAGKPVYQPTLGDVATYIRALWQAKDNPGIPERSRVSLLKRYLVFVGEGVDPQGAFLHRVRRVESCAELDAVLSDCLEGANASRPFADEPFPGIVARPSRES